MNRPHQNGRTRGAHSTITDITLQHDDIIIPVLGLTGAGRSTFINIAAGEHKASVSGGILSCTRDVQLVPYSNPTWGRIVLIDTPGFDHTSLRESEIVGKIANCLKDLHKKHLKISGIIFLHDIAHTNYTSLKTALVDVETLSGKHSVKNVVLATTKWGYSQLASDEEERRQRQLQDVEWRSLISRGAQATQFSCTKQSAWKIVDIIAKERFKAPPQIQQEKKRSCFSKMRLRC